MKKPYDHPAYNAALQHAAKRANEERGECFSVYYDGEKMFVRSSKYEEKPDNAECVCIAQYWGERGPHHAVQLRFDGAWSEWVNF